MTEKIKKEAAPKNYSHDALLSEMFKYVFNNYRDTRGLYFHVANECPPYPGESDDSYKKRLGHRREIGNVAGVVDHLFYWKGKLYGFDAKTGSGKLEPEQKAFIAGLKEHGGNGWEIRDLETFKKIIATIIN